MAYKLLKVERYRHSKIRSSHLKPEVHKTGLLKISYFGKMAFLNFERPPDYESWMDIVLIFYFSMFIFIFLVDQGGWLATQSTPPWIRPCDHCRTGFFKQTINFLEILTDGSKRPSNCLLLRPLTVKKDSFEQLVALLKPPAYFNFYSNP